MEKTNVTTTETTNVTPPAAKRRYWWKAIASFLMVLFTMPLGHGLMIIMEHLMSETVLHYSAFVMGAVGMAMVIVGVFAKRRYAPNTLGDSSAVCSSGQAGWNFSSCILPTVSARSRNSTL